MPFAVVMSSVIPTSVLRCGICTPLRTFCKLTFYSLQRAAGASEHFPRGAQFQPLPCLAGASNASPCCFSCFDYALKFALECRRGKTLRRRSSAGSSGKFMRTRWCPANVLRTGEYILSGRTCSRPFDRLFCLFLPFRPRAGPPFARNIRRHFASRSQRPCLGRLPVVTRKRGLRLSWTS
jgi:hypothetical protein